jgi:membrane protein DedA with SNARE-associated domain
MWVTWKRSRSITKRKVYGNVCGKIWLCGNLYRNLLGGATTVILGGMPFKLGHREPGRVMFRTFLGTFAGDSIFFTLGKIFGKNRGEKYGFLHRSAYIADNITRKYCSLIIPITRFLARIRAVPLILPGRTNTRIKRFAFLNLCNSMPRGVVVSFMGYGFGRVVNAPLEDMKEHQERVIAGLAIAAMLPVVVYRHIAKEEERVYGDE